MSGENVIKITCSVNRIRTLSDMLPFIRGAGKLRDANLHVDFIDITDDTATVIGNGLSSLNVDMTSLGYETKLGPNKTHLFLKPKE